MRIAAPAALTPPAGAVLIQVRTAQEMLEAVLRTTDEAEALLMAAAVADFRPRQTAAQKMKREKGVPVLSLEPAPDILAAVAERRRSRGRAPGVGGFAGGAGGTF